MDRKILYIILVLIAFNLFSGFNLERIPRWIKAQMDYQKEQWDSSRKNYERAIGSENDSVMHYNKGAADYRDGDFTAAEESFTKAIEADPDFEAAHYNQGNARFRNGNLQGAVESYENALAIDPDDEDAQYNLDFVKKLLENQANSDAQGDPKGDQQKQQQQSGTEGDSSKESQNNQEGNEGQQKDSTTSEEQGESSGGEPQPDQEPFSQSGGGGTEETEEEPPNDMQDNESNLSGLTDQQIQNLLDALEEQERALAGRMDRRPYGDEDEPSDPFGIFEELWSIHDDLDPFARKRRKQRDPDEIDW